ncbi:hypothetical protein AB4072_08805 [Microvirga sp. 2MCAF38]|uniref:hypothetical protein n=1 Tax=Microvirga sp. 2MCAF38 TaxID=3232989 RepID=UPI003F9E7D54
MSVVAAKKELLRFLATSTPEVLALRGRWGVGKTFTWNRVLKEAKKDGAIAIETYAYVSLFGLETLDQVRTATFENSIPRDEIGAPASTETFLKKHSGILEKIPALKNLSGGIQALGALSISNTIICIDDFERRGSKLRPDDIMGLISQFKEQRNCKIIIILNEDELKDEERKAFRRHHDKVIDRSVDFAPTPVEAAGIALKKEVRYSDLLNQSCIDLGIDNIRVLRKINRFMQEVDPLIAGFHEEVLKQVAKTVPLLVLGDLTGEPSIEFLKSRKQDLLNQGRERPEQPEEERRWSALLDGYNFSHLDELDLALLEGVQRGYFDEDKLKLAASDLEKQSSSREAHQAFESAWELYHGSFDDNRDEFVSALEANFQNAIPFLTPRNLNSTVKVLKKLGCRDKALDMLGLYVAKRVEEIDFFDLNDDALLDAELDDPDVRQAFQEKITSFVDERDPRAILIAIGRNRGWDPKDIDLIASLSIEEFKQMFKATKGSDLKRIVKTCLDFGRIVDADNKMKEIHKKATDALREIGTESPLNALRVGKWGVVV